MLHDSSGGTLRLVRDNKNNNNDWQRALDDYARACIEYETARAAAATHSATVTTLTAALLAEQQARDKVVALRQRLLYRDAEPL